MDPFEKKLLHALHSVPGLVAGQALVVAVSGGPDSVALLIALSRLSDRLGHPLRAIHVNHGLRGQESNGDERFVVDLCRQLGLPLTVRRLPEPEAGAGNLEEWMRRLRYDLLEEAATAAGGVVVTAHHADDQAETLLLKLARGAGLTGLAGIYPRLEKEPGRPRVIRPLLSFRKQELARYLERRGKTFRVDAGNLTTELDRNWVRLELLPSMIRRLNPRTIEHLGRTATLARETEEFLAECARAALPKALRSRGDGFLELDIPELMSRPLALRRYLIRDSVLSLGHSAPGLDFDAVDAIVSLLESPSGRRVELPRGIVASRQFDRLLLKVNRPAVPFSCPLPIPGECRIEAVGKTVRVEAWPRCLPAPGAIRLGGIEGHLTVRSRRPGDVFCNRAGRRRKLKKVFHDEQVPADLRDRLILLTSAGRIVWVEGLWPHPDFQSEQEMQLSLHVSDETFHP